MAQFTITDLRSILSSCAGVDDAVELDETSGEELFTDLGYDSLAILELCGRIQRLYGVVVPDEAAEEMLTPNQAVEYVTGLLTETAAA